MTIQSVQKALDILSLFNVAQPQLGLVDISRLMDLPKTTIHGLVQTLANQGFLHQDPETKRYTLGLRLYELGTLLPGTLKINQVGVELVQRLSILTGLVARIAIWDNQSILITQNLFPTSEYFPYQQLGPRVPAYCTSLGKAVLSTLIKTELDSYLSTTKLAKFTTNTITNKRQLHQELKISQQNGFAVESEEMYIGLSCLATPIFDRSRKAIGAVSLSGRPDILAEDNLEKTLPELKDAGMELSRRLGFLSEAMVVF